MKVRKNVYCYVPSVTTKKVSEQERMQLLRNELEELHEWVKVQIENLSIYYEEHELAHDDGFLGKEAIEANTELYKYGLEGSFYQKWGTIFSLLKQML